MVHEGLQTRRISRKNQQRHPPNYPKLIVQIIEDSVGGKLIGQVLEVTIFPAPPAEQTTTEAEGAETNRLDKIKNIRKSIESNSTKA